MAITGLARMCQQFASHQTRNLTGLYGRRRRREPPPVPEHGASIVVREEGGRATAFKVWEQDRWVEYPLTREDASMHAVDAHVASAELTSGTRRLAARSDWQVGRDQPALAPRDRRPRSGTL